MDRFPDYQDHANVTCFHCKAPMPKAKPAATSYPTGKWKKRCPKCKQWTFYDLKVGPTEPTTK